MTAKQIENPARLRAHILAVEHAETRHLATEKQAFGNSQVFGKIEFLVDDDDAQRFGRTVSRKRYRLAVEQDLARGRLLET